MVRDRGWGFDFFKIQIPYSWGMMSSQIPYFEKKIILARGELPIKCSTIAG